VTVQNEFAVKAYNDEVYYLFLFIFWRFQLTLF